MKKTIIIIAGGIVFSTLFYAQNLGINALLYSLFLIVTLLINHKKLLFKKTIILSGIAMLASATAICAHGSDWSVFMYFLSTFLFLGYIASSQSSIYVSWLNGIYTSLFGMFHSLFYQLEKEQKPDNVEKIDIAQVIKLVIIPVILIVIFTLLYRSSNPIFNEVLEVIDFSFIDIFWLFTAAIGSLIMANIEKPQAIQELTKKDQEIPNELQPKSLNDLQIKSVQNESQIGLISILCLNLLLVFVLITELLFLTNLNTTQASVLSQAVHQGVYASIASIVIAIGIIAFIYRGDVNFLKNNQKLRALTYIWIILNALLVASIFTKNYLYIDEHGLTHKRIGVIVYLFLTMAGLVTTYLKVNHRLNFVYLIRRNLVISYTTLAFYGLINWSAIITEHNIVEEKVSRTYLESLLPQNALVLKKYNLYDDYKSQTKSSIYHYDDYNEYDFINRNWQEFNWIAHQLKASNENISKATAAAK